MPELYIKWFGKRIPGESRINDSLIEEEGLGAMVGRNKEGNIEERAGMDDFAKYL